MTPTRTEIKFPMIVSGRRYEGSDELVDIKPTGNCSTLFPPFTAALGEELLSLNRNALVDIPLQEITGFLHRTGKNWRSDGYHRRRLFISRLQHVLGYSESAAEAEADWIATILSSHARMHDLVQAELGDAAILDDWIRSEEAFIRAYPRGLVAHVLPGNVPASSILSIVRALITKNISVAKVASGDPLTAHMFALSLLDVDDSHPVAKAVNVVYWPEDDPLGAAVVNAADAVCAWGSAPAIRWARGCAAPEATFLPFGPKWSFALVGAHADVAQAALGAAHDISLYDQEACFSTQRIYVDKSVAEAFITELESALIRYEELLPPRVLSVDEAAKLNASRTELEYDGGELRFAGTRFSVMIMPPARRQVVPLGRTVIVHPVDDVGEACEYIDHTVQTVATFPWELAIEYRHPFALAGAGRFVELGMSNFFRIGGAHDGLRPLQSLVRYASTEAPARIYSKGMVLPLDQTDFLENRRFKDLIF